MVDIYYQSNIEYKFISKLNTILDLQYENYKKLIIETILKELHEKKIPSLFDFEIDGTKVISTSNYKTLEEFIVENKQNGLTHIVIDDKKDRQEFLRSIILNESDYLYLEKEFDSKDLEFEYNVKMFKINYELFYSIMKQHNNEGE